MDYYYTDAQNQPRGPVSVEQLRELLNSGAVNASTQVAAVGSQQWVPILTVVQAAAAPSGAVGAGPVGAGPVTGISGGAIVPAGPTEPLAVWSLVLGILAVLPVCCSFMIFGIGAVVTGHMAMSSLKKNPNRQGRGMALAGLIMGYIGVALGILGIIFGVLGQILDATKH